jgi:hypothetical protein
MFGSRKYRSKKGARPFCEELERIARFFAARPQKMRPKYQLAAVSTLKF